MVIKTKVENSTSKQNPYKNVLRKQSSNGTALSQVNSVSSNISSLAGCGALGDSFSSLSLKTGPSVDSLADSKVFLKEEEISDGTQNFDGDENEERGNWSGKLDFLMSLLGYAVGVGNVWRFPYLCYRNGGGAFLIPYVIMLTFVGMPLFFLELSLGQFTSNGPLTCWAFAPIFQGIGIAQLIVSSLVAIYYNMIIAWSLHYMIATLTALPGLPWASCDNKWNTEDCFDLLPDATCDTDDGFLRAEDGQCFNHTEFVGLWDYDKFKNVTGRRRAPATEEYYLNHVLGISDGIDDLGQAKWDLVLSLLLAWIIAFCCMVKGIKSSGKVVYFTALFPYCVLFILLIRGVTLPNAGSGIYFYMVPKWERLADAKVWNDAAVQIFISLSNCWGGLIALASYNRFHNPCLRDTILVTLVNCGTSVFAGFVIFSFLGFMAGEINTPVENVVDSGPGLAFIVYPDAVSRMPGAPIWAFVFFAMLVTLGLDSQFAMLETILTSLLDQFKLLRPHKTKVVALMSFILFLLGLTLCTNGGAYMLQLMDTYCGGWAILVIGIVECIAISWVYGADRFYSDIQIMIGVRPKLWWRFNWQFASPLLILFVLLFAWIDYTPARYGTYKFPVWADGLGWLMTTCSIIWIPIWAGYLVWKEKTGTIIQRIKTLFKPTMHWGPALKKHRRLVKYVPDFVIDPNDTKHAKKETLSGEANSAFVPDTGGNSPGRSSFYLTGVCANSVHSLARSQLSTSSLQTQNNFNFESVV